MTYQDALAEFAARGRLVLYDDTGAMVLVGNDETFVRPAQLSTAASMLCRTDPDILDAPQNVGPDPECSTAAEPDMTVESFTAVAALWACVSHAAYEFRESDWFDFQMRLEEENADSTLRSPIVNSETPHSGERRKIMNYHVCAATNKKTFAGQDGKCKNCRDEGARQNQTYVAEEILEPIHEYPEPPDEYPTLASIIQSIGGESVFAASVSILAHHKRAGGAGNDVDGRKTREVLDLIMAQPEVIRDGLLVEYATYLRKYNIALNTQGLFPHHDYTALRGARGEQLRQQRWQQSQVVYRAQLREQSAQKREAKNIVMHWISSDKRESGYTTIGPNNEETRKKAALLQAAGHKKGFSVLFKIES